MFDFSRYKYTNGGIYKSDLPHCRIMNLPPVLPRHTTTKCTRSSISLHLFSRYGQQAHPLEDNAPASAGIPDCY